MLAGTIEIEMLANMARLTQDLNSLKGHVGSTMESIEKSVEGAKHALEALGIGLSISEFARFVNDAVEAADALNKLSQRTGIAVELLSQLQYAAKQAGVAGDALTQGIKKLNVSVSEGIGGVSAKTEAFANLGISLRDATGHAKTADQILLEVADRFSTVKDGATKTAYAVALFGKAGDEMIPMLNKGSVGIKDMMDQADKLGLTISKDFAAKAEDWKTNMTILESSSHKLAITLGGALVESLGDVAKKMAEATIAGGKMHGIMVGLDALGDQMFDWTRHQDEKPLQWLKDDLETLKTQAAGIKIDLFGQKGALEAEIAQKEKELADMQAKFYRLTDLQGGRGTVNPALVTPEKTDELKALSGGGIAPEVAEYQKLVKSIQERIAAGNQEIAFGRTLTEAEKFEIKVLTDMKEAKVKLTAAHQAAIKNYLEEAKAVANVNAERAAELHNNANYAREWAKDEADIAAADKARADERDRVNKTIYDQAQALADSNQQIALEASLLGATDQVRQLALANLQVEIDKKHEIEKINQDLLLGEKERLAAIANVEANAAIAHAQASARSALQEQLTLVSQIESVGKSAWDAFWQSGSNRIKAIGQLLRQFILDQLYQMVAKPFILNIAANIVGGGAGGIAGSALSSAAGGGINGVLGGVGSAFMAGYNGVGTATSIASLGGDAMGSAAGTLGAVDSAAASEALGLSATAEATTAATSGIATGIGAGIEAGLASVPVYGWIALGAMALFSAFGGSGGGPKSEAGYAPNGMDISGIDIGGSRQGSQRGDVGAAQQISAGISASYQAIADQLGLVKDKIDVGLFYAQDPQGTSMTQLQVVGGNYNRSQQEGGIENVARGDQALKDAIALATAQLILSNLQSSDLKGKVGDYIKAINPSGMTAEQINASITLAANAQSLYTIFGKLGPEFSSFTDLSVDAINKLADASGGVQQLAANLGAWYNDFHTDAEKRADTIAAIVKTLNGAGLQITADQIASATHEQVRAYGDWLAAIGNTDGFNALASVADALNAVVPAAQAAAVAIDGVTQASDAQIMSDVANASRALADARQAEASDLQTAISNLQNTRDQFRQFATDLRNFRDSLIFGSLSPLTPAQKYAEAQAQFEQIKAAALAGDPAALAKLQDASQTFLQASQTYNASNSTYQADFAEVQAALTMAGSAADAQATSAESQLAIAQSQLTALQAINQSVLTVDQALASLAQAIYAAVAAGLNPGAANIAALAGGVTGQPVNTPAGSVYVSGGGAVDLNGTIFALNGQSYTRGQAVDYINGLMQAGRTSDIYYAFKTAGISLADADRLMGWPANSAESIATAMGLPVFHEGVDFVPRTGLALLEQGERVIPRRGNTAAGDMAELLDTLIEEVRDGNGKQVDGVRAMIGANYDAHDRSSGRVVDGVMTAADRAARRRELAQGAVPA